MEPHDSETRTACTNGDREPADAPEKGLPAEAMRRLAAFRLEAAPVRRRLPPSVIRIVSVLAAAASLYGLYLLLGWLLLD